MRGALALFFMCSAFVVFATTHTNAQIKKPDDVEEVQSRYVVSSDAVFVYFLPNEPLPYKVYDFSTRAVYTYFGDAEKGLLSVTPYTEMVVEEIKFIQDIGCGNSSLTSDFRRFCK